MKLKTTSKLQLPIARTLHLSTSHMHNLNVHKVKMSIYFLIILIDVENTDMTHHPLILFSAVMCPGNTKRAIYILQNALELGAKPKEILQTALHSMQGGKTHLFCSEDKENIQCKYSLLL